MRAESIFGEKTHFTALEKAALSYMKKNNVTECHSKRRHFTLFCRPAEEFAEEHLGEAEKLKQVKDALNACGELSIERKVAFDVIIERNEETAKVLEKIAGNIYRFNNIYLTDIKI